MYNNNDYAEYVDDYDYLGSLSTVLLKTVNLIFNKTGKKSIRIGGGEINKILYPKLQLYSGGVAGQIMLRMREKIERRKRQEMEKSR